jgi:hypothetical protein
MPIYGAIVHRLKKEIEELREQRLAPFDFILGGTCKVEYLVAEEDKDFKAGDAKPIRIKKVTIPKNTLLLISPYGRHGVGQVISIGEEIAMPVELDRSADYALFVAGVDGSVRRDELVGVAMLTPITPRKGA